MSDFQKCIDHLKEEFAKLQVGRASGGLVENIMLSAYGSSQPLKALASISTPDAKTIQVQPWDKALIPVIEKALRDADLNMNPTNNGSAVILNVPPLTEERRRDLVKIVGRLAEEARVSVRNIRHDSMAKYKRMEHDGDMTEDDRNRSEKQLQEAVDKANASIADLAKQKEESIMKV
jgi:ribosome recycling factor